MISKYSNVPQLIQPNNDTGIDIFAKAAMYKNAKLETSHNEIQNIFDGYSNLYAQLPKNSDKDYVQQKVNGLLSKVNAYTDNNHITADSDYEIKSIAGELLNDKNVQNALVSKKNMETNQKTLEMIQSNPKYMKLYRASNVEEYQTKLKSYMDNSEVGKLFGDKLELYSGLDEEIDLAGKNVKDKTFEEQTDNEYVNALVKTKTASDVQNATVGTIYNNPNHYKQAQTDAMYEYGFNRDPQVATNKVISRIKQTKDFYNSQIEDLQKKAALVNDQNNPVLKGRYQENIDALKKQKEVFEGYEKKANNGDLEAIKGLATQIKINDLANQNSSKHSFEDRKYVKNLAKTLAQDDYFKQQNLNNQIATLKLKELELSGKSTLKDNDDSLKLYEKGLLDKKSLGDVLAGNKSLAQVMSENQSIGGSPFSNSPMLNDAVIENTETYDVINKDLSNLKDENIAIFRNFRNNLLPQLFKGTDQNEKLQDFYKKYPGLKEDPSKKDILWGKEHIAQLTTAIDAIDKSSGSIVKGLTNKVREDLKKVQENNYLYSLQEAQIKEVEDELLKDKKYKGYTKEKLLAQATKSTLAPYSPFEGVASVDGNTTLDETNRIQFGQDFIQKRNEIIRNKYGSIFSPQYRTTDFLNEDGTKKNDDPNAQQKLSQIRGNILNSVEINAIVDGKEVGLSTTIAGKPNKNYDKELGQFDRAKTKILSYHPYTGEVVVQLQNSKGEDMSPGKEVRIKVPKYTGDLILNYIGEGTVDDYLTQRKKSITESLFNLPKKKALEILGQSTFSVEHYNFPNGANLQYKVSDIFNDERRGTKSYQIDFNIGGEYGFSINRENPEELSKQLGEIYDKLVMETQKNNSQKGLVSTQQEIKEQAFKLLIQGIKENKIPKF